jgi:hypothetical protein
LGAQQPFHPSAQFGVAGTGLVEIRGPGRGARLLERGQVDLIHARLGGFHVFDFLTSSFESGAFRGPFASPARQFRQACSASSIAE